jgi:GNAT superfamily N-acetyltransferase
VIHPWHALCVDAESISIRRLEPGDWSTWKVLWQAYLDFYREQLPDELTAATFARLCADDGDLVGLVAADRKNEPVGIAHLVFHPSTWSATTYCYLEDLFVAPRVRGRDVGRRLIEAVYDEADRRGSTNVYWHTQEFNGAARSLYDTVAHRTFIVYER